MLELGGGPGQVLCCAPPPRTLRWSWLHGLLRTLRRRCAFLDLRPIRVRGRQRKQTTRAALLIWTRPAGACQSATQAEGRPRGRTATARGFRICGHLILRREMMVFRASSTWAGPSARQMSERGSAVSHMEHARGHPGLLMGGCNESPARSSATQACQVSHMEHVTPPREPNVGGMLCRM